MKRVIIALICLLVTISLSYAEDKSFSGSIKVGGSAVDLKDSATLVSEYSKENKNDINPLVEIKGTYDKDAYIDFKARYIHPENQYYKLKFDGNRVFRFETDYQRFFHITSKDNLNNLWAHAGIDNPNDSDNFAEPMFNPNIALRNQIGSATVYNTDRSTLKSYGKSISEWANKLLVNLPGLNGITFGVNSKLLERKGFDHSTVTAHCSSCHITGYDKKIDEKTTTINPFIDGKLGKASFNFSINSREFTNNVEQSFLYDRSGSPLTKTGNPFSDRILFDNTEGYLPANIDPDSSKLTKSIKFRYDFSKNANLIITGLTSDNRNKSTDGSYDFLRGKYDKVLESENKSIDLKYHRKINKDLTFNMKAYYKNQDSDDVYVKIYTIPRTLTFTRQSGFPNYSSFMRHSLYNRDEYGLSADVNYKVNKQLSLFAMLGFDKIERDNAHEYEVTEDTKKYTLKLGANYKPSSTLKTKLAYKYTKIDDPFIYFKAGCAEEFKRLDSSNNPVYYDVTNNKYSLDALYGPMVYDRRKAGMSIEPTGEHNIDLTLNYLPSEKMFIDLSGKYKDAKNSDLATYDWKRKIYSANANLNYSVNQDLMLYVGYNYLREKYDSILCASYYDGWANIILSSQVGSKQNNISYKNEANTILLGGKYNLNKKTDLSANFVYNRIKGYIEGPNFANSEWTDKKLGYLYDGVDNIQDKNSSEVLLYNFAYMNILPELSDLEYDIFDFNISGDYKIKDNLKLSLGYLMSIVKDKKGYVYGDEDGKVHTVTASITYNF